MAVWGGINLQMLSPYVLGIALSDVSTQVDKLAKRLPAENYARELARLTTMRDAISAEIERRANG